MPLQDSCRAGGAPTGFLEGQPGPATPPGYRQGNARCRIKFDPTPPLRPGPGPPRGGQYSLLAQLTTFQLTISKTESHTRPREATGEATGAANGPQKQSSRSRLVCISSTTAIRGHGMPPEMSSTVFLMKITASVGFETADVGSHPASAGPQPAHRDVQDSP